MTQTQLGTVATVTTKTERSNESTKLLVTMRMVPLNPGVRQHRLSGYQTLPLMETRSWTRTRTRPVTDMTRT